MRVSVVGLGHYSLVDPEKRRHGSGDAERVSAAVVEKTKKRAALAEKLGLRVIL